MLAALKNSQAPLPQISFFSFMFPSDFNVPPGLKTTDQVLRKLRSEEIKVQSKTALTDATPEPNPTQLLIQFCSVTQIF